VPEGVQAQGKAAHNEDQPPEPKAHGDDILPIKRKGFSLHFRLR